MCRKKGARGLVVKPRWEVNERIQMPQEPPPQPLAGSPAPTLSPPAAQTSGSSSSELQKPPPASISTHSLQQLAGSTVISGAPVCREWDDSWDEQAEDEQEWQQLSANVALACSPPSVGTGPTGGTPQIVQTPPPHTLRLNPRRLPTLSLTLSPRHLPR